jgi:hypothetical protein
MKIMKYALKKYAALAGTAAAISFAWLNTALAQSNTLGGGNSQPINLPDPLGGQTFSQVTANILSFIFYDVAIPLTVIMVLVGAFQMMTAAGNPEKFSQGRKTLMYAALGFGVALIAGGLATLLQSILSGQ